MAKAKTRKEAVPKREVTPKRKEVPKREEAECILCENYAKVRYVNAGEYPPKETTEFKCLVFGVSIHAIVLLECNRYVKK